MAHRGVAAKEEELQALLEASVAGGMGHWFIRASIG